MIETLIYPLTWSAGLLALAVFVSYSIVARWWQTRSGTAYWVLFLSLIILAGHFILEDLFGQAPIREVIVLIILHGALAHNFIVIFWKQWNFQHDGRHPHHH